MDDAAPAGVFRFLPMDRVAFGSGAVRRLPAELDRRGLRRALVITGQSLANRTNVIWYIEELLGPRHAATFSGARQHVPSATVAEALDLARMAGADCMVSVGGGSPIDTAKAVAYRLAFDTPDAAAEPQASRPDGAAAPLPHFAVPTTLSAAEFTHLAGVTDEGSRVKRGLAEPRLAPRAVFLDPDLTVPTPSPLWLASGIKALDHAIESYLSPRAQPLVDALALEAVRLLSTWLPRSHDDPSDRTARAHLQVAAWMSIFGGASIGVGLSHAFGHQIGARRDVPHGVTSCITLPHVLRFVAPERPERMAALATAMGNTPGSGDALAPAAAGGSDERDDAAGRVTALVRRLGLPARLRDAGVAADSLDPIADAVWDEIKGMPQTRPLGSVDRVRSLLQAMW
ncbi:MAG: iron-containing alcohol dehydrogenase [Dehalococcoidia bacterium]